MLQPMQHRNSSNNAKEEPATAFGSGSPPVSPRQNKWNLDSTTDKTPQQQSNVKDEDIQKMRDSHSQEVQTLKDQLAQLQEGNDQKQNLSATTTTTTTTDKEQDEDLMMQLEDLKLALASTQTELQQERDQKQQPHHHNNEHEQHQELIEQLDELRKQHVRVEATCSPSGNLIELEDTKKAHQEEVEMLKVEHAKTIERLQEQNLATTTTPQQQQQQQQQLLFSIQQLQAEVNSLRENHANEMDEILAQLDEVEAEHTQQLQQANVTVQEQEVLAKALTHELTTKTQQWHTLEDGMSEQRHQITQLQEQLEQTQTELHEWQEKYASSHEHYERALDVERSNTIQAADDARLEMIEQAESQFENANHMYVQLKQEFAASLEANQQLQGELATAHQDVETIDANASQQQESFQQQLEQMKQDLDQVQEVAIHDRQHFHSELGRIQEVHDGLIQKLEGAQEAHRTLERTLAMLIMEKEQMAKENTELKGVCEETMALLETHERGSQQ